MATEIARFFVFAERAGTVHLEQAIEGESGVAGPPLLARGTDLRLSYPPLGNSESEGQPTGRYQQEASLSSTGFIGAGVLIDASIVGPCGSTRPSATVDVNLTTLYPDGSDRSRLVRGSSGWRFPCPSEPETRWRGLSFGAVTDQYMGVACQPPGIARAVTEVGLPDGQTYVPFVLAIPVRYLSAHRRRFHHPSTVPRDEVLASRLSRLLIRVGPRRMRVNEAMPPSDLGGSFN